MKQQVAVLIADALDAAALVKEKQDADRQFVAAIRAHMFRKPTPVSAADDFGAQLAAMAALADLMGL